MRVQSQANRIILILVLLQLAIGFSVADKQSDLQYNKNFLDSEIVDLIWCGSDTENDKNVLVQTENGTIYRSSNKMVHFENINENLISLGVTLVADNRITVEGEVTKMIRSTANPNLIILQGKEYINWITKDCGNTFKAFSKKNEKINLIKLHPTQQALILATTNNRCQKNNSNKPCFQFSILWLSKDFGQSWEQLTNYIYKFDWGFLNFTDKSQVPVQRIYWVQEDGNTKDQNRYGLAENRNLYYSDDFFVTKKKILDKGNSFYLDSQYFYAVQLVDSNNQLVNLKVADPRQKEIRFRDVVLGEKVQNLQFTILDTQEGQVFINVNHLGKTSPMGTLYISDANGARFSTSLQGQLRGDSGDTDFERLHGIYGVFIANVYSKKRLEEFESTFVNLLAEAEDKSGEDTKNKKSNTSLKQDKKVLKIKELAEKNVETMITFDKGGIWNRIPGPKVDHNGKEINCGDNCFLNIHSNSNDKYNSFYSSKNAVGIVLANGNVGKYLQHQPQNVNTYLSRDAGLTWTQIKKGAYVFEIGDHGSVIVMAKDKDYATTKSIEYSLDEGLTWKEVVISENELEVDNIITEPSNVGTSFMVLAKTVSEKKHIGIAVTIDFANQFTRNCSGIANAGDKDSDYELWIPHGYQSHQCMLGSTLTYSRKKRDSICLNGESFDRIVEMQVCECQTEDWECDFGYYRKGDGPCVRDGTLTEQEYEGAIPEICPDYYEVSRGYRKIPFNNCRGGVDYSPELRRCPGNEFFSLRNFENFVILALCLAAIYYGYQYRSQLEKIIQYLSSVIPLIYSHRKDYIDFSKVNSDHHDESKIMKLFSFSNQPAVNHYSNINDHEDEEESLNNREKPGQYNNLNQHNYFADDAFEDDHHSNQI